MWWPQKLGRVPSKDDAPIKRRWRSSGTAAVLLFLLMSQRQSGDQAPLQVLPDTRCDAAIFHAAAFEAPSLEARGPDPSSRAQATADNMLGRLRNQTESSYRVQDERTARQSRSSRTTDADGP